MGGLHSTHFPGQLDAIEWKGLVSLGKMAVAEKKTKKRGLKNILSHHFQSITIRSAMAGYTN